MKNLTHTPSRGCQSTPRASRAFTLIEMLVVISIISILAAILLPAIARAKVQAQKRKALMEVGQIANAIHTYESDYNGKYPVSAAAMSAASAVGEDITYGTAGVTCVGPGGPNPPGAGFGTPTSGVYAPIISAVANYQTNNSEVMAVLLDMEYWSVPGGVATINLGHVKNPKRTQYLNANRASSTNSPGLGPDGVYRDPWGNPYVITVDLNYDDKARDGFYRLRAVSQDNGASGINGLVNAHTPPSPPNGNSDYFECNSPVMVWSAGPDKMIDPTSPATKGANKDNVLSWKQ